MIGKMCNGALPSKVFCMLNIFGANLFNTQNTFAVFNWKYPLNVQLIEHFLAKNVLQTEHLILSWRSSAILQQVLRITKAKRVHHIDAPPFSMLTKTSQVLFNQLIEFVAAVFHDSEGTRHDVFHLRRFIEQNLEEHPYRFLGNNDFDYLHRLVYLVGSLQD